MVMHVATVSKIFHRKPATAVEPGSSRGRPLSMVRAAAIAALDCVLIPSVAAGQLNAGRIVGTVTDPSRAPIPQVT